jgi:hypothetical protein
MTASKRARRWMSGVVVTLCVAYVCAYLAYRSERVVPGTRGDFLVSDTILDYILFYPAWMIDRVFGGPTITLEGGMTLEVEP